MIDCRECRRLIDRDLEAPLPPPDRAAIANHVRECEACRTYRQDRLQERSLVRPSVAALAEEAERPPPLAPPAAPRRWPRLAILLLLAGALGLLLAVLARPRPSTRPPASPPRVEGAAAPARVPAPPRPEPKPPPPPPAPAAPQGVILHCVDLRGRPVPGAAVALTRHPEPAALVQLAQADRAGTLQVEPPPAGSTLFITAWTDRAVGGPVAVRGPGAVNLTLRPGKRLEVVLEPTGGVPPQGGLLGVFGRGGRVVGRIRGRRARLVLPPGAATELRPWVARLRGRAFLLPPPGPLMLAPDVAGRITLSAAPARVVAVRLPKAPPGPPRFLAAATAGGEVYPFEAVPDLPGTYAALVPPEPAVLHAVWPGYAAVHRPLPPFASQLLALTLVRSSWHVAGRLHVRPLGRGGEARLRLRPAGRDDPCPPLVVPVGPEGAFQSAASPWREVFLEAAVGGLVHRFGPFLLPAAGLGLTLALGEVRGKVLDAQSRPQPGVAVTLRAGEGEAYAVTDPEGRFRFPAVPAGPARLYPRILAAAWEAGLPRETLPVRVPAGGVVEQVVRLKGTQPVELRLETERREPVTATVLLRSRRGTLLGVALPPADPGVAYTARFPALLPGTYRLEVQLARGTVFLGPLTLPHPGPVTLPAGAGLRITCRGEPSAPAVPLRLELGRPGGESLRWESPDPQEALLAGLEPGLYHVRAARGHRRGRGLVRIQQADRTYSLPLVLR